MNGASVQFTWLGALALILLSVVWGSRPSGRWIVWLLAVLIVYVLVVDWRRVVGLLVARSPAS